MAIVFISPKKRQQKFFLAITVLFLLFISFVSLSVFLSEPKAVPEEQVLITPKININFKILESDKIKYVQPIGKIEKSFSYEALTDKKILKVGIILAVSEEEAKKALEATGLTVNKLEEARVGRGNPFIPYYVIAIPQTANK